HEVKRHEDVEGLAIGRDRYAEGERGDREQGEGVGDAAHQNDEQRDHDRGAADRRRDHAGRGHAAGDRGDGDGAHGPPSAKLRGESTSRPCPPRITRTLYSPAGASRPCITGTSASCPLARTTRPKGW